MTHSTKPFVNKIRQAPEVASKPERIVKDLENAKTLAKLLEAEYDTIRKYKEEKPALSADESAAKSDEPAPDADTERIDDDMQEPGERGSEAIERRLDKIRAELPDASSEQLVSLQSRVLQQRRTHTGGTFVECDCTRLVFSLPPSRVPHMLLLCLHDG
jgi:hypothetical protein